jgi:hypothetical protein
LRFSENERRLRNPLLQADLKAVFEHSPQHVRFVRFVVVLVAVLLVWGEFRM